MEDVVDDDDDDDDEDDDVAAAVVLDISTFGSSLIFIFVALLAAFGDDNEDAIDDFVGHIITGFAIHSCHTRSGIVVVDGMGLCMVAE